MKRIAILIIACAAAAACSDPEPRTVAQFMENEAALQGTLVRCEQDRGAAAQDQECINAKRALQRLAVIEERALAKARGEAFEKARAEYRARLDAERRMRIQAQQAAREARERALLGGYSFDEGPEPGPDADSSPAEDPPPDPTDDSGSE
jgi:hypothetical protein